METFEHVRVVVERLNAEQKHGLSTKEIEHATIIGTEVWRGHVGIGHAAESAINSVKKLRKQLYS